MTPKGFEFQPGAILHDAIVGTFRAHGRSFEGWCHENGTTPSNARNATFGQSRGPKGRELLDRIIDGAGRVLGAVCISALDTHITLAEAQKKLVSPTIDAARKISLAMGAF